MTAQLDANCDVPQSGCRRPGPFVSAGPAPLLGLTGTELGAPQAAAPHLALPGGVAGSG